jgi:hypothetical protein
VRRGELVVVRRGLRVVRWTWRELDPFDAVAERLRRHFR